MKLAYLALLVVAICIGLGLIGMGLLIRLYENPLSYYISGTLIIVIFSVAALILDKISR